MSTEQEEQEKTYYDGILKPKHLPDYAEWKGPLSADSGPSLGIAAWARSMHLTPHRWY